MRWIAHIKDDVIQNDDQKYRRLIVDETPQGDIYLYYSLEEEDRGTSYDDWYESLEEAFEAAYETFGLTKEDWLQLDEPMEHCFRNFQRNVRKHKSGEYLEVFEDEEWKPL